MQTIARATLRFAASSLVAAFALVLVSGCNRDKDKGAPAGSVDAPPALAKAAENPAPVAALPATTGAPATRDTAKADHATNDASDDGADEDVAADDEERSDEPPAKTSRSKKKRSKSKKPGVRKRASSNEPAEHEADNDTEQADHVPVLRVKRIQFSPSVKGREPVEPEETFSAAELDKVFAFIELTNEEKLETKVVVTFIPPMGAHSKVTLKVGDKARWRTWAQRKSPKAVGTWKVVVHDEAGRELGHRTFEVTE
ncbi:MAG: DUF2914 domain-containing protein [Polyangiaceae bacterium]|nr:DUF2914 domain-containing protein [Polyangiaceae bacterium]